MPSIKEVYLFDPQPQYPFLFTAARYPCSNAEEGATLIFSHGIGQCKEHWEPIIEQLYELEQMRGGFRIREAWIIECPNHGDSAILNEEKLLAGCYDTIFSWEEYARAIHAFITGLGKLKLKEGHDECEAKIDFTKRKLVCVGHSMGSTAFILTQEFHPPIKFSSFILVEPVLITIPLQRKFGLIDFAAGVGSRQDVWPSRAHAWEMFNSRGGWQKWDQRVLKLYVHHGLRDIPSSDPEGRTGVTLKCPKKQEVACFRDLVGRQRGYDLLDLLCSTYPVHVIWAGMSEMHPGIKADVENVAAQGKLASVQIIPGVKHLAPQLAPMMVADAVYAAFVNTHYRSKI